MTYIYIYPFTQVGVSIVMGDTQARWLVYFMELIENPYDLSWMI